MTQRNLGVASLMAIVALVALPVAAATTVPRGAEHKAILDAVRLPVTNVLKQPVDFVVEKILVSGPWAFVIATPNGQKGKAIPWQSIPACRGDVSHLVGALLRHERSGWKVRALAVCPTDVAWADWPTRYGAPQELFD
jgi:hypothetical protein